MARWVAGRGTAAKSRPSYKADCLPYERKIHNTKCSVTLPGSRKKTGGGMGPGDVSQGSRCLVFGAIDIRLSSDMRCYDWTAGGDKHRVPPATGSVGVQWCALQARVRGWLAGSGWVPLEIDGSHGPPHHPFSSIFHLQPASRQKQGARAAAEEPIGDTADHGQCVGFHSWWL